MSIVYREATTDDIVMPGMASAHSHAFQRLLRARTQRPKTGASSFWSWRDLMYQLAQLIEPDDLYHIARFAYAELAMSGVTTVGEFHYLHHDRNGVPYQDRTVMAQTLIAAARDVGIRVCLIRCAYLRAGHEQKTTAAQRRFIDADVQDVLYDVERLHALYRHDPAVRIAVAAHSVRAVPLPAIVQLADYASDQGMPFHMHVAEQQRELHESIAEYGVPPVQLLAQHDVLSERFVAVHATHLNAEEIEAVSEAQSFVCICRTTERDLGDGLPPTTHFAESGVRLCVGVDGYTGVDAYEDIRAVELDERSRVQRRHILDAEALLQIACDNGRQACGFESDPGDIVKLDARDPALATAADDQLIDAVIYAGHPRAVRSVVIDGTEIVADGRHLLYDEILQQLHKTLRKLELSNALAA